MSCRHYFSSTGNNSDKSLQIDYVGHSR